jgi:Xaa-Pro aminopeptidase
MTIKINAKIQRMQQMIAESLIEQKADAVVVISPENVYYASEIFIVSHRWVPERLVMVVFHQQAAPTHLVCNIQEGFVRSEDGWIKDIRTYTEYVTSPIQLLVDILEQKGLSHHKVLIEKQHLTAKYDEELRETLPDCEFDDCGPLMDAIRQIKTPEEITILKGKCQIVGESPN